MLHSYTSYAGREGVRCAELSRGESQFGHRISENLDFFTKDLFDEDALIQSSEFCPILA